jgi:hypothetical protein
MRERPLRALGDPCVDGGDRVRFEWHDAFGVELAEGDT